MWIACFAILLAALAPTVSRILAAACNPASYVADVCATGDSAATVAAHEMGHAGDHSGGHAGHHSSEPAKKEFHFEHCPFCVTHAGSFGLQPGDGFDLPAISISRFFPPLFYQSHHPLFAWVTPHSRAPPAQDLC